MTLTDKKLRDLEDACNTASRNVNVFSDTFSRWCALEKKLAAERRRRRS